MKPPTRLALFAAPLMVALTAVIVSARAADDKAASSPVRPSLTVNVTQPQTAVLGSSIGANGSIAAWQEASVGTEANGLRLAEVRVNVGDVVKRGQALAEAATNAQRARELQPTGALSAQQINQYLTAERTAQARVEAQRAAAQVQQLRVRQTQVLAPDNGVISARSATVGAVLPAGQELFRLIRQGRLEWRAEVAASDLMKLKPGLPVSITPAGGEPIRGQVRMVAPTVDTATRNGLVYVDLPQPGMARAGMFARGEFQLSSGEALTLPQTAVQLRDRAHFGLRDLVVRAHTQPKVSAGRRSGERIEITGGLDRTARVVLAGGGFLNDGDTVRVVETTAPAAAASSARSANAK